MIELGRQPETFAEVQTQVRQREEQHQAREAHQHTVRQQAQLYQQLDQAEQALKTFPAGSLAWEREQQELERQLVVLRQQASETVPTAPEALPTGGQQSLKQHRSEREYQEAIHAWAQARGWNVRHGPYGGTQRDWQIGLMAVGKVELARLAAELGV